MKFGTDRVKPDGTWVQTTIAEKVVGVQYRLENSRAFANAVREAEKRGLTYGLQLEAQPNNPHDRNAIAVYGVCEVAGLLKSSQKEWHIGFLPRELAEELHEDLLKSGIPIAAELLSIYEGSDGYLDFNLIVLAPKGHSHKARLRRRE